MNLALCRIPVEADVCIFLPSLLTATKQSNNYAHKRSDAHFILYFVTAHDAVVTSMMTGTQFGLETDQFIKHSQNGSVVVAVKHSQEHLV